MAEMGLACGLETARHDRGRGLEVSVIGILSDLGFWTLDAELSESTAVSPRLRLKWKQVGFLAMTQSRVGGCRLIAEQSSSG